MRPVKGQPEYQVYRKMCKDTLRPAIDLRRLNRLIPGILPILLPASAIKGRLTVRGWSCPLLRVSDSQGHPNDASNQSTGGAIDGRLGLRRMGSKKPGELWGCQFGC